MLTSRWRPSSLRAREGRGRRAHEGPARTAHAPGGEPRAARPAFRSPHNEYPGQDERAAVEAAQSRLGLALERAEAHAWSPVASQGAQRQRKKTKQNPVLTSETLPGLSGCSLCPARPSLALASSGSTCFAPRFGLHLSLFFPSSSHNPVRGLLAVFPSRSGRPSQGRAEVRGCLQFRAAHSGEGALRRASGPGPSAAWTSPLLVRRSDSVGEAQVEGGTGSLSRPGSPGST